MKVKALLVLVLVLLAFAATTSAREIIIENTGYPNSIMQAIEADAAAVGADVAATTKYVLRRGETYVHTEKYSPTFSVWLEAEPGNGPRPRILGVNLGGEAPRAVQPSADFKLVSVRYEGYDSDGNHTDNAPIRPKGEGLTAWIEDCIFDNHRLEIDRTDGSHQKRFWYNNIVRNNQQNNRWIKGGVFFLKNLPVDTFVVKNNTFYNNTTQLVRGTAIGAKFYDFSNNTVYNQGGLQDYYMYQNNGEEQGLLDFGPSQNVVCKDNLFINFGVFGYPPAEADSLYLFAMKETDSTGTIDLSHNNVFRDPEFATLNPDTVEMLKMFDPELVARFGETGSAHGFISEQVFFNNAPDVGPFKQAVSNFFASPTAYLEPLTLDDTPDPAEADFGYTAKASPTASSTGGPLGSSQWNAVTAVADRGINTVESFNLHGNYPNPFNPTTAIRFDLAQNATVKLSVMNVRGQIVYETPEKDMVSGSNHEINVNASSWASGVYLYKLVAQNSDAQHVANGRMLLIK